MDRNNIINNYSKSEFMDFLSNDTTGMILELFNEEGCNILKKSKIGTERICYILNYSNYKNELLKNDLFLETFLSLDITDYYASLRELNPDTYDSILNKCIELNIKDKDFTTLFSYFATNYKISKVKNWPYKKELLYRLLYDEPEILSIIVNNYNIDICQTDIPSFFRNCKELYLRTQMQKMRYEQSTTDLQIPVRLITKELATKLWNGADIFEVRKTINDASYVTDPTVINDYIKEQEDRIIKSSDTLLSPYKELYETYYNYINEGIKIKDGLTEDDELFYKYRREYHKIVFSLKGDYIFNNIEMIYNNEGLQSVLLYIKSLSDRTISNYIIDYHFEENYHNITIDIKELLHFYYDGNISIPKDRIELYEKITNIDNISYEEKLALHEHLKHLNMMEIFYDDMAYARSIVAEAIKDYSLTSESIQEYKDEELSKEYGVDIFVMKDNYFFGIVKTGRHVQDALPTGHSYSLIGRGGIAVYGDPKDSETFLYDADSMNPEQLVHAFPYDSYTMYHPFEFSTKSTKRVNVLMTPEQLVEENSNSYNELLLLEKGTIETGIDPKIPQLKQIALYCVDEIREQDIEVAKTHGVGIILVDSKNCTLSKGRLSNEFHGQDINYLDDLYELEKFEATR